jgi:hypothetical protein
MFGTRACDCPLYARNHESEFMARHCTHVVVELSLILRASGLLAIVVAVAEVVGLWKPWEFSEFCYLGLAM